MTHNNNVSLPTQKPLPPLVQSLISRYPAKEDFLSDYNASNMQKYAKVPDRCVLGTAPTLTTIELAYGHVVGVQWIMTLLVHCSEFSGAKNKINTFQLRTLAEKISLRYSHLKASEIMLFFEKLESGDFGRFSWENFDPLRILEAFRPFMDYRAEILDKEESRLRDIAMEEARRNAVPCPPEIRQRLDQLFAQNPSQRND